MTTGVKICGLTTPETLDVALDGGARFVGAVIFEKSPRHLEPLEAASLFERARRRANVVAVVVDPGDRLLTEIGLMLRPNFIQLHGSETPARAEEVRRLTGAGIIKALPIRSAEDFGAADEWAPFADHLMFDAKPPEGADLPGGVGASFDWSLLAGHIRKGGAFKNPWFLAGGLNPENVA